MSDSKETKSTKKINKNKIILGLCSMVGVGILIAGGMYVNNNGENQVLSSIGNTSIKYKDIQPYLKLEEQNLYELNPEISEEDLNFSMEVCKSITLTKLENSLILYNKAIELGVIEDADLFEDEVEEVFEGFKSSFETVEEYDNYIQQRNYPKERIYSIIRDEFIYSKLYTYYMDQVVLTEDEVLEYFKEYINTIEESYEFEEIKDIMEMNIKNQRAYEQIEENLKKWRAELGLQS